MCEYKRSAQIREKGTSEQMYIDWVRYHGYYVLYFMGPVNICLNEWKNKWMIGGLMQKQKTNSLESLLKNQQNIYYIPVSIGQEFEYGLAGSSGSGSLTRLQSRCWLRLGSPQGSSRRRSSSKITPVAVGRIEFLACCWTEGFSSSVAVGQKPPHLLAGWTLA